MSVKKPVFSTEEISLEQWKAFMERLPEISPIIDIACILTPNHEFLCVNEAATEPYDMDPEDFVGECCYELVHNQDQPIEKCPCEQTLETGEPMEGGVFEEHGRYYVSAAAPIYGDDDDIVALAHTVRDVTEQHRREQQLREFEQAVEASDDLIAAVGQDDTYTFANGAYTDYYQAEDIVGKDIPEVVGRDTFDSKIKPHHEKALAGNSVQYERTETFPGRGERTLAVRYAPIWDDSEVRGLVAVLRDITERKHREQALQARSKVMEASIDGMAILDENEMYAFVNKAHAYIYGYDTPDAFIGNSWRMCYNEDELVRFDEQILPILYETGSWRGEATGVRKDGTTFPQELSLSITDNGQIVCVVRDITELKQRERELELKNERLEEFASAISHDLRNPLNVVQGRTELAMEEEDWDHLEYAAASIDRSLEMVDDLLTLARTGEDVGDIERISLEEVATTSWQNVETGDAALSVEPGLSLMADRGRLLQLFENLFRNAIEHGGTDVAVSVGVLGGGTGFYVADDGAGIPPEERESVFEMGYSTGESGTGLGLRIVNQIVEAHGWEINVTESQSGGTRFEIETDHQTE